MKLEEIKQTLKRIDEVFDPKNKLHESLEKSRPKLALEITPTKRHTFSQDLFRIYTYSLLRELSKKFEIVLIYRDIQATIEMTLQESKRSVQEGISLLSSSKIPFKMYYESEILQKHLENMPENFFRHLYSNILSRQHNHFTKDLMASSASQAVLIPLLELLNIDVLLCMKEEKENMRIVRKIQSENDYFPVIFYRSLKDLKNREHSFEDHIRNFPNIGWKDKDIYHSFKICNTSFETLLDWYKKLGILESKNLEYEGEIISFEELYNSVKHNKIRNEVAMRSVSRHLASFMEREGEFLELASKEMKIHLENDNSDKILNCLNTPSRINIIKLLDKGNLTAYEIAKQINVSLPTTLFHLKKMQDVGIIERTNNKSYILKMNRFVLYI